jgi:TolA-binding protein
MKKKILLTIMLFNFIYAEQSVYSDSSFIDSDAVTKKNSREIFILKQKISQLKEKIEGLKSIVEGQSNTIEQLRAKTNNNLENIVNQLSQRVATIESELKDIKSMKASTTQIMPKSETVANNTNKEKNIDITDTKKEPKSTSTKKLSSKELFKQSVLDFNNAKLTKAKEGFKNLIKRSYKRASSNYYLGEIAFKKGRYKEAIEYYQKSVTLNDSASYMANLLLHTAISLKKKGRSSEAKTFFNAVITSYPDTKAAKEAKKYIKK